MNILAVLCIIIKNSIYGLSVFFTGALTDSVAVFDILALRFLISFAVFYILKVTGILKIKAGIKDLIIKDKSDIQKRDLFSGVF